MSIMVSSKGDFELAPAGVHNAVCVDIIEYGWDVHKFRGKEWVQNDIAIVWEIDEKMQDDRPFTIRSFYNATLGPKSKLKADLQKWRGREFTDEELEGFDVETVLGAPCQVLIEHGRKQDGTMRDKVSTVLPAGKEKLTPSGRHERMVDRPDYVKPVPTDETVALMAKKGLDGYGNPLPKTDEVIEDESGSYSDVDDSDIPF